MRRGQAVRRGTFDPVCEGSNPCAPAISTGRGSIGRGSTGRGAGTFMGEPFMATGFGELKIFSGSAHPDLTREIASFLGVSPGQSRLRRFPDSEVSFQIDENIRGTDVFVVQPTCTPVDQHIIEMLIMIDAFKRSSAARITAVLPYFGYARQDRK